MRFCPCFVVTGFVLTLATMVYAKNPLDEYQQFSALASGGPLKWNKMKIYRSGNQIRGEYTSNDEVRIANEAAGNGWVIRPLKWEKVPKECNRMTLLDISSYPFFAYTTDKFDVERTSMPESTETIDGHPSKIEEYSVKLKDGGQPILMKLWRAEDLKGFPVQIEIKPPSRPEFTISYSEVSLEKPDPKLFQLPALCRAGKSSQKKTGPASTKRPAAKPSEPKPQ